MSKNNKTVDRIQAVWNIIGGEEGADRLIAGEAKVVKVEDVKVTKILRLTKSPILVSAVPEPFVVADHFQVNVGGGVSKLWNYGEVKIAYIGQGFKTHHLRKVIGVREVQVLSSYELTSSVYSLALRAELGVDIETDEAGLLDTLKGQREGERGVLRTDGYANIFFITSIYGISRMVDVRFDGRGWCIGERDLTTYVHQYVTPQVFSRDSSK